MNQSFRDYYEYYLTLHTKRETKLLHVLGQKVTVIFAIDVFAHGHWYFVPLIPFVVYPFAWSGHYFFEKNKPAAWSKPLWAKACDWVMLWEILTGKIKL